MPAGSKKDDRKHRLQFPRSSFVLSTTPLASGGGFKDLMGKQRLPRSMSSSPPLSSLTLVSFHTQWEIGFKPLWINDWSLLWMHGSRRWYIWDTALN